MKDAKFLIIKFTFVYLENYTSHVTGVDVSPFINNLPAVANINPKSFSTSSASGSTSMAANIIESMEFNPQLFLLDEDTCARYTHN